MCMVDSTPRSCWNPTFPTRASSSSCLFEQFRGRQDLIRHFNDVVEVFVIRETNDRGTTASAIFKSKGAAQSARSAISSIGGKHCRSDISVGNIPEYLYHWLFASLLDMPPPIALGSILEPKFNGEAGNLRLRERDFLAKFSVFAFQYPFYRHSGGAEDIVNTLSPSAGHRIN